MLTRLTTDWRLKKTCYRFEIEKGRQIFAFWIKWNITAFWFMNIKTLLRADFSTVGLSVCLCGAGLLFAACLSDTHLLERVVLTCGLYDLLWLPAYMPVWVGLWRCLCVLPKRWRQVEGLKVERLTEVSSVRKVREFRRVLRAREMRGQMWLNLSFEVKRRFVNYDICVRDLSY